MVISFEEGYERRIARGNAKLEEMYDALDPMSQTYLEDVQAAASLHAEVAKDSKNYGDLKEEAKKNEQEKESAFIGNIIKAASVGVSLLGVIVAAWSEKNRDLRFKILGKFEDENAVLKMTDRKIVEEGLRDSKGFFGLFK